MKHNSSVRLPTAHCTISKSMIGSICNGVYKKKYKLKQGHETAAYARPLVHGKVKARAPSHMLSFDSMGTPI